MEAILDTNFIVGCTKRGIEFLDILKEMGFKVILPKEVYQELKDLKIKVSHNERFIIELAISNLDNKKIKKMKLGKKKVDVGLIEYGKKGAYIATLDSAIKREVPNKVIISNADNSLTIERK